jgi:hypothetical protein
MARDGSGTYNLPNAAVVTGTPISSTSYNSTLTDLASALTQSLSRDGQTIPSAALPMGTYNHTNVGNATARNQYAALGQVQDGAALWGGTAGGTANALTATLSPAITAYSAGMVVAFINGAAANTAADPTLTLNGLATRVIKNASGGQIPPGALPASGLIRLQDDGTNWRLMNMPPLGATVTRSTAQSITSGATTAVSFDAAPFNSMAAWVVGSPTRLTFPVAGRVALTAQGQWGFTAAGARFLQFRRNGSTGVGGVIQDAVATAVTEQSAYLEIAVSAADYIELVVTQDSGGALNFAAAQMTARWVG